MAESSHDLVGGVEFAHELQALLLILQELRCATTRDDQAVEVLSVDLVEIHGDWEAVALQLDASIVLGTWDVAHSLDPLSSLAARAACFHLFTMSHVKIIMSEYEVAET